MIFDLYDAETKEAEDVEFDEVDLEEIAPDVSLDLEEDEEGNWS